MRVTDRLHTDNCWLQVHENCSGNMFAGTSLAEERAEGVIAASDSLIRGHLAVRLDPMFKTVQFPAGIAHLGTGLPHVD